MRKGFSDETNLMATGTTVEQETEKIKTPIDVLNN